MTEKKHPAFISDGIPDVEYEGLTAGEYAAIHLRLPQSGTPWLDDMIRESLRNDFVKKMTSVELVELTMAEWHPSVLAGRIVRLSEAMLAEMEKKP